MLTQVALTSAHAKATPSHEADCIGRTGPQGEDGEHGHQIPPMSGWSIMWLG